MIQIIKEIEKTNDLKLLVTILELIENKLDIDTISEMARKEGKSPNGIRQSNCYRKLKIGKQTMAVKGIRDNKLPF